MTFTHKKKTRLISAQGPGQVLNVLAILNYQQDIENDLQCEDHLVLGGFAANSRKQVDSIIKTCIDLASAWNFQSITYLDVEKNKRQSFSEQANQARSKLGLDRVDVFYVCRNWQLFNELLLEACKDSRKICYGDGFGWLDLNDTKWQKLAINPQGYAKIDSAYLFMPIEADQAGKSFSLVDKIVQPPIHYLVDTVHKLTSKLDNLQEYCTHLESQVNQGFALVIGSNYAEAGQIKDEVLGAKSSSRGLWQKWVLKLKFWVKQKTLFLLDLMGIGFVPGRAQRKALLEAHMYFEQIERYCPKTDVILIKPHPRETLNQSHMLHEMLTNSGYKASRIDDQFSCIPIELLASLLNIKKAICMNSSSSLSLPLISNLKPNSIYPYMSKDIAQKYINEDLRISDMDIRLTMNLLKQSVEGMFIPTRKVDMKNSLDV
jgi:hypothetical protein